MTVFSKLLVFQTVKYKTAAMPHIVASATTPIRLLKPSGFSGIAVSDTWEAFRVE